MSSNLMDTAKGGENTQYESIKTVTESPAKESGQFGGTSTERSNDSAGASSVEKSRGAQTAENIRYGQAMSEQGVGGFTVPERNDGGAGGGSKDDVQQLRKGQGYTAETEMDRNIGG